MYYNSDDEADKSDKAAYKLDCNPDNVDHMANKFYHSHIVLLLFIINLPGPRTIDFVEFFKSNFTS